MKKLALSVAALALTAGAALAADLPSRKGPPVLPPPPPPPPMWTGFYAGLNAGYGFGTNDNVQTASWGQGTGFVGKWHDGYGENYSYGTFGNSTTFGSGLALSGVGANTQSGFIGGGQIGYNYQWGQSIVIGIEADMQGTGIRGTSWNGGVGSDTALAGSRTNAYHDYQNYATTLGSNAIGGTTVHAGVDWLGTVRGRVGYLFTPTMLVFATGGLTYGGAWAHVNQLAYSTTFSSTAYGDGSGYTNPYGVTNTFIGAGQGSKTLVGWNVGGGLEWMFMPNWSVKAEAIYWNMGNATLTHFATAAPSAPYAGSYELCNPLDQVGNSPAVAIGATRVNYQGVIARAGVNYHFNWGAPVAPVVAKY